jgi:hypothetical protein
MWKGKVAAALWTTFDIPNEGDNVLLLLSRVYTAMITTVHIDVENDITPFKCRIPYNFHYHYIKIINVIAREFKDMFLLLEYQYLYVNINSPRDCKRDILCPP